MNTIFKSPKMGNSGNGHPTGRLCSIVFATLFAFSLDASGRISVSLRGGDEVSSGVKALQSGTNRFDYVLWPGEAAVENGVVAILIDRPYQESFPSIKIPKSISLIRGEGIGGDSKSAPRYIYSRYHSDGISNQALRHGFHLWFGNKQRTDEPLDTRRREFLFAEDDTRNYRTVMLLKYRRASTESTTRIPFSFGYSMSQKHANVTIVDLKDGLTDPVSLSIKLLPISE